MLDRLQQAIAEGETRHDGQVCFAIEGAQNLRAWWRGTTPRQRAEEVFAHLRVWDTHNNSGVLIYVLLAERAIEIVADRGIAAKVAQSEWVSICERMRQQLRRTRIRTRFARRHRRRHRHCSPRISRRSRQAERIVGSTGSAVSRDFRTSDGILSCRLRRTNVGGCNPSDETTMLTFILWLLLLVFCWPLALLALVLYPFVWLLLLPFRLVGLAVEGVFAFLAAMIFLPARVLRGRP